MNLLKAGVVTPVCSITSVLLIHPPVFIYLSHSILFLCYIFTVVVAYGY